MRNPRKRSLKEHSQWVADGGLNVCSNCGEELLGKTNRPTANMDNYVCLTGAGNFQPHSTYTRATSSQNL